MKLINHINQDLGAFWEEELSLNHEVWVFDARSMGCISGSVAVGLRAMFRLIPVAFKL